MQDLRNDNRGAIMLTGLFMACFLIGSLWFVIGIGDTIVFRDRMQEATDHGAFASAALHAKGMNFIALCNVVLLAAVTIHLILGIIHDIALAICIVSVGFACGFWIGVRKIYTGYFDILKPAAQVIHVAAKVASYGYPVMGVVEGMQVGRKYEKKGSDVTVIPLSTSLLPGALIRGLGVSSFKKEGLPVEARKMSYVCKKVTNVGFAALFQRALGISGKSASGKVLDVVKAIIGGVLELRYCNDLGAGTGRLSQTRITGKIGDGNKRIDEENDRIDRSNAMRLPGMPQEERYERVDSGGSGGIDPGFNSFWGKDGPFVVFGAGRNGNEWFQTYALNVQPEFEDENERKIALAKGPNTLAKYIANEKPIGYVSQAEFYFDCDEKWTDDHCNNEDNALFQIKWRARLRRIEAPSLTNIVGGMGFEMMLNLRGVNRFTNMQGVFGKQARRIFGGGGVLGRTVVRSFTSYFTRKFETAIQDKINEVGSKAQAPINEAQNEINGIKAPATPGIYH
jgi:hypothetical protein